MENVRIVSIVGVLLFYGIYFGKSLAMKRQNIVVNQLAVGKKGKAFWMEFMMLALQYAVVVAMVLSILFAPETSKKLVSVGLVFDYVSVLIFFTAIWNMRDSWRAGIPLTDKTSLVTRGIYQWSRNPAFLAFDMLFAGVVLTFFNWPLLIIALAAAISFHLQILEEEKFLTHQFGSEYQRYRFRVFRYFGQRMF